MKINLEIDEKKLDGFNHQAIDALKNEIEKYSKELIDETARIERRLSSNSSGAPQITSSMLRSAIEILRNNLGPSKITWSGASLKIISAFALGAVAILFKELNVSQGHNIAVFIGVIVVAVIINTFNVMRGN